MPRAAYRLQTAYRPKQTKSGCNASLWSEPSPKHKQTARALPIRHILPAADRPPPKPKPTRIPLPTGTPLPPMPFPHRRHTRPMPSARSYPASISTIAPPSHCAPTNRTKSATRYAISTVPTTNRNYAPFPRRARHKLPDCRVGGGNVPSRVAYQTRRLTQTAAPHSGQERQFPPDIGQTVGKIRTFRPLPPLGHIAHFAARNPSVGDVEVEPANNRRHSFFQKFTLCRILTKAHPPDNAEIQTHPRHFFRQRRPSANRPN